MRPEGKRKARDLRSGNSVNTRSKECKVDADFGSARNLMPLLLHFDASALAFSDILIPAALKHPGQADLSPQHISEILNRQLDWIITSLGCCKN